MLRINDILDKAQSYLPASDLEMIEKAYIFSASDLPIDMPRHPRLPLAVTVRRTRWRLSALSAATSRRTLSLLRERLLGRCAARFSFPGHEGCHEPRDSTQSRVALPPVADCKLFAQPPGVARSAVREQS